MTLPVKILSVLAGLSLAGSARARIWTNDRGATVVAVLVAVRDAEVDLKLQDGRVVAVPGIFFPEPIRNIFWNGQSLAGRSLIRMWGLRILLCRGIPADGTFPWSRIGMLPGRRG
ncbi:MAG: hypothetical protein ACLRPT_00355 [Akkermansia muciniphila]